MAADRNPNRCDTSDEKFCSESMNSSANCSHSTVSNPAEKGRERERERGRGREGERRHGR
jgi:hypothetical protein